jgi:hypothetical protein
MWKEKGERARKRESGKKDRIKTERGDDDKMSAWGVSK